MTTTYTLATTGTKESEIPVSISYRIIELFSAGLYSSPNKAIEELVATPYKFRWVQFGEAYAN